MNHTNFANRVDVKKVLSFIFISFVLIQCHDREKKSEFDLPFIQERDTMKVLMANNTYSYFYYRGRPYGYEYELAASLAKTLQVKLKIKIVNSIEDAMMMLNQGEGDVLAFPLTVTPERSKKITFTNPFFSTRQVLVQKKPFDWRLLPHATLEKCLIRTPQGLKGKEIVLPRGSAFKKNLNDYMALVHHQYILIEEDSAEEETLTHQVASGEIEYTINDEYLAKLIVHTLPQLDIKTQISPSYPIAWAVRKTSPELVKAINRWQKQNKRSGIQPFLYKKYFEMPRQTTRRIESEYSSLGGKKISPYDNIIKQEAVRLPWDWRLLTSLMFQESGFDPSAESWAGAIGLLQVMPDWSSTVRDDLFDPVKNIKAGVTQLKFLNRYWKKSVRDSTDRIKFILASYNLGITHVQDAQTLTWKYECDSTHWELVEKYLLKKNQSLYYKDPDVKAGFCRCQGVVNYVHEIIHRYEEFQKLIDE